jgi:hypothetical protein
MTFDLLCVFLVCALAGAALAWWGWRRRKRNPLATIYRSKWFRAEMEKSMRDCFDGPRAKFAAELKRRGVLLPQKPKDGAA